MKKELSFILFFLSASFCFCQVADKTKIIEIPSSYAERQGPPTQVKKDSLYRFGTTEIYLVNKKSFIALKNLYENVGSKNDITKALLESYSATLKENLTLEERLKANFTQIDSLDNIGFRQATSTLQKTQESLDYTIESLQKATNNLENAEKNIKSQRRKTVFEKILIGVAGVGAGVLIGVSL